MVHNTFWKQTRVDIDNKSNNAQRKRDDANSATHVPIANIYVDI